MAKNLLTNLELEELSLVDRPANAEATVSLFKRDNSEEENIDKMTDGQKEEMDKMSDGMKNKMRSYLDKGYSYDDAKKMAEEEMKKSEEVETLKADNERLRKALLDAGYVIKADTIEKKAEPEYIEYGGEQINKADVPAPILKALEEAELEKRDNELTKRAESELPHFDVNVAKSFLDLVEKSQEVDALMEALKAADKAFSRSMEEFGKTDIDGDLEDPMTALNKMAEEYKKEHGGTIEKARAAVYKTDKGATLLKKYYEENK
jgi:hypothetical protein